MLKKSPENVSRFNTRRRITQKGVSPDYMILKNKKRFTLQSPKKRFNEEYKSETFLCKSRTIQNGALVELSSVYAFVLSQN
jgi:hypothetical protein